MSRLVGHLRLASRGGFVAGDGVRFSSGAPRVDLEPISTQRSGTSTILRFRVRREQGSGPRDNH